MPNRDGTGPQGKQRGTGRGRGVPAEECPECGTERSPEKESGSNAGEVGWEVGAGPGGVCICLRCKREVKHITGVPCKELKCPDCGVLMARKL